MTKIYEVKSCEEYEWQQSEGLYSSLEMAMQDYPSYSEVVYQSSILTVIALPEHANKVKEAMKDKTGYWWYSLPHHGMLDNYDSMVFYGIWTREVID